MLQAELSLYPLRTKDLGSPISRFVEVFEEAGLDVKMGAMSTVVTGDETAFFRTLEKAYRIAAEEPVVIVAKISNACPA